MRYVVYVEVIYLHFCLHCLHFCLHYLHFVYTTYTLVCTTYTRSHKTQQHRGRVCRT